MVERDMNERLVTFNRWCIDKNGRTLVSINPIEVSSIEDFCGTEWCPGSQIIMKNKKSYLVYGTHTDIIAALNGK